MIGRIWHGWTSRDNADTYERLLREEILVGITARGISGYQGIQLFRRESGDEVEFLTLMKFESLDSIRSFVGEDDEAAFVPAEARMLLSRFDDRAQHYEVREDV
jgi:heme-degrading monooxygenase HmoA